VRQNITVQPEVQQQLPARQTEPACMPCMMCGMGMDSVTVSVAPLARHLHVF